MAVMTAVIDFLSECTDEVLALMVVGGTMAGYFMSVEIPLELAGGILVYYFAKVATTKSE